MTLIIIRFIQIKHGDTINNEFSRITVLLIGIIN